MIALLGAGPETRPSCLMRKGYRRPWAPQTEKRYLGSTLLDLEGDTVSGGLLKSLMIGEFPSLSAPVAQLASHLSVLLVSPF